MFETKFLLENVRCIVGNEKKAGKEKENLEHKMR